MTIPDLKKDEQQKLDAMTETNIDTWIESEKIKEVPILTENVGWDD